LGRKAGAPPHKTVQRTENSLCPTKAEVATYYKTPGALIMQSDVNTGNNYLFELSRHATPYKTY